MATCGKTAFQAGYATGISFPHLWGKFPGGGLPPTRNTEAVAFFVGELDTHYTIDDINATGGEIRQRNNLAGLVHVVDPFMDTRSDDSQTQRRVFKNFDALGEPFPEFCRYFVKKVDNGMAPHINSVGHSMPDVDNCLGAIMTCDYNYTDRTMGFFETYAELNLIP